jgi:hypothetical protein
LLRLPFRGVHGRRVAQIVTSNKVVL